MPLVEELAIDIAASWLRLFVALLLSIIFSIVVGVAAATNEKLERIILPSLDVMQTIPIMGFFPLAVYIIVLLLPGYMGVNLAVVFLIFTSMVWNITFGVYEAIKAIPRDLIDMAKMNHFTTEKLYSSLYVPAALPRIAYQSVLSWSIGLFYLVTSEIFSTGSANFEVGHGIGIAISNLAANPDPAAYLVALTMFVIAIILTRIFFLSPLAAFAERYSFSETPVQKKKVAMLKFYSRIYYWIKLHIFPVFKNKAVLPFKGIGKAGRYLIRESFVIKNILTRQERLRLSRKATWFLLLLLFVIAVTFAINAGVETYAPIVLISLTASFVRVWSMYLLSVIIAVPLAILIARSKRAFEPAISVLQIVSAIPATIMLPAIIILLHSMPFGGEISAFFIIFLAMIWYLLFSVISGMRSLPASFIELSSILGFKERSKWRRIYLPSILPYFITGSITAVGGAWNALIVAEYFTVVSNGNREILSQVNIGIGKLIDQSVFSGNLTLMILSITAMSIMVIVINRLFWQRLYNIVTSRYVPEV
jgi:NitT/TauT family transport system permease protein